MFCLETSTLAIQAEELQMIYEEQVHVFRHPLGQGSTTTDWPAPMNPVHQHRRRDCHAVFSMVRVALIAFQSDCVQKMGREG